MAIEKEVPKKAGDTVRVGADAVSGQARDAIDTLRETVSVGADASRTAAGAAGQTAERASAATRDITTKAAETTGRVTEEAAQRFGQFFSASARVSEEAAQRTQQTVDALLQTSSVVGEGMQAIMREWVNYAQGAMQRQADAVNEILKVRSVQDLLAIQTERVRREMEQLLDTSTRISEQAAKASSEAYGKLHSQAEQGRRAA
ncbi:phasin family protein [Arenibaculum pallidiluteum]|uniref:phasin family protein n=1 Tax=Arenibaculum pallidiluteum TaxID=2812559 RepID=UPI001A95C9AD|nr:phasin family protein [Arenibaculum pallidiluteum]